MWRVLCFPNSKYLFENQSLGCESLIFANSSAVMSNAMLDVILLRLRTVPLIRIRRLMLMELLVAVKFVFALYFYRYIYMY